MSSSVSNLQLLNNTEHRLKFKTGSDIDNVKDPIPGELFLEKPDPSIKGSVLPNKHSLSLDASSNQYAAISNLEISGAFTISMWLNWTSSFDGAPHFSMDPLFHKDYESHGTTDIVLNKGNGRLRFSIYDRSQAWGTAYLQAQATFSPILGRWYHIMLTYSGETNPSISGTGFDTALKIFVDGTELTSVKDFAQDFNGINSPASTIALLGRSGALNEKYFDGKIDQVAIWNSDQSANIASIYTSKNPNDLNLTPNSPDHWFKLNNNTANSTGSSTLDLIGSPSFSTDVSFDAETLPYNKLYTCTNLGVKKLDGKTKVETNYTFGGGQFSLSAWIKTTNPDNFIIASDSQTGGSDSSFAIGFKNSTTPYVLIGNPGQQIHQSSTIPNPINDGQWHHIGVSINGSYQMRFAVDGVVEATHTFSILPGPGDHVVHYGTGWSDGTPPIYDTWGFEGELVNLAIWEQDILDVHWQGFYKSGPYGDYASRYPSPSQNADLWIGPNNEIKKITDLTAKMGDAPMLQLNDANLDVTNTFSPSDPNGYWGMSFWFKVLEVSPTGTQSLYINMGTTAGIYINTSESKREVLLRDFGFLNPMATNTPLVYGVDGTWYNPDKFDEQSAKSTGPKMYYEPGKLHNFAFVKKPSPISGKIRAEFWLDGELIGYTNDTAGYYPWAPTLASINPNNHDLSKVLFGDLAYWDSDVSSIVDRMYNPSGKDKGYQGDYMNLSIQPHHYYKLGLSMNDLGTDGTNHLTSRQPIEETFTVGAYADQSYLFQPQGGVMHGLSNGESNPYDPEMFMFVGDTINFTRPDSSHPLHIKDSSGNDVAVQNSTISNTYALSFNGSNHVDCGVLTALHGSPEMSLSFWFKSNTAGEGPSIGSRTGFANQWGFLRTGGVNYVQVVTQSDGKYFTYSSPSDTDYHHYLLTFSAGTLVLYIDGSVVPHTATNTGNGVATTLHSVNVGFNIGKNDSFYSDGLFDEVSIFNSALTASDITYIYNRGAPNDISSLNPIDWWRCGDDNLGSGTTITDQGIDSNGNPSGNDGSLVGNPTFSTDTPTAFITTFSPTIAGTYQYYCTSHSSMIGNINVLKREGYENIFGIDRSLG